MELKSTIAFFFLLFLLLAFPHFSTGRLIDEVADSEIYEIDYRGPETHSSAMSPPGRSHGRPFIHRQHAVSSPKSRGSSTFSGDGDNAEEVHG